MKEHNTIVEKWDSFKRFGKIACLQNVGIAIAKAEDYVDNYSWSTLPKKVQDDLQKEYPGVWKKR